MKYQGKLTMLAGCLALLCGAANAQNPARDDAREPNVATAASDEYQASLRHRDYLQGADLRASQIVGAPVRNMQGEELGEIEELVIGENEEMLVIVSVGGFLGVGEKRAAVPYDELRVAADGETFYINRDRAALESGATYSYRERDDAAEAQLAQRANDDTVAQRAAREEAREAGEEARERAARTTREADEGRETTLTRERDDQARDTAAIAAALDADDHRASAIIGATVVDSAGEDIGDIDDLVVSSDTGKIQAVLSIGGIAGVGDKLVAVPFEDLQIAPATDASDTPRLRLDMNAAQARESLPEFRYERQVAQGSETRPRG